MGESAGFVVSGYYRTTDGHYRNLFLDKKVVDDAEDWAVDGRLVFQAIANRDLVVVRDVVMLLVAVVVVVNFAVDVLYALVDPRLRPSDA